MLPYQSHPRISRLLIRAAYTVLTFRPPCGNVSKFGVHGEWIMNKLTKQAVKDLAKPEMGQTFLWDGELRGFGVRAIPSGLKTFVLQYRNTEGRSRRIVLGRFGVMTVEQARDEARIKLGEIGRAHV